MASISTSKSARTGSVTRRIVWVIDGRQIALRLGTCDLKTAMAVKLHVERLLVASASYSPVAADTAAWLGHISGTLHDRLSRTGICEPRLARDKTTIGAVFDAFVA